MPLIFNVGFILVSVIVYSQRSIHSKESQRCYLLVRKEKKGPFFTAINELYCHATTVSRNLKTA